MFLTINFAGTSSLRRSAQLKVSFPQLKFEVILLRKYRYYRYFCILTISNWLNSLSLDLIILRISAVTWTPGWGSWTPLTESTPQSYSPSQGSPGRHYFFLPIFSVLVKVEWLVYKATAARKASCPWRSPAPFKRIQLLLFIHFLHCLPRHPKLESAQQSSNLKCFF